MSIMNRPSPIAASSGAASESKISIPECQRGLDVDIVTRILHRRGFFLIDRPQISAYPRPDSLMVVNAWDSTARRVFIKVARARLLGRSKLYNSHRLLQWLEHCGYRSHVVTFPKAFGYFREGGLSFLVLQFVEHWPGWETRSFADQFREFTQVIQALKQVSGFPPFLERYHYRKVGKTLQDYAKYVGKHAKRINQPTLTRVLDLFRRNEKLFEHFYGVFSHNDIQCANLLHTMHGAAARFCLVDVETCRVANEFSDFARCYNRGVLATAKAQFLNYGVFNGFESPETYRAVLAFYDHDKLAKRMFDIMIIVDSLMQLYWTLHHESDDAKEFVETVLSTALRVRLSHF